MISSPTQIFDTITELINTTTFRIQKKPLKLWVFTAILFAQNLYYFLPGETKYRLKGE